ncbi:hypothetical protein HK101_001600 [Irineochytrium annulatum]|nr:hypothetical protein HK101_001600 [Irineochytrium annulatum]
MFLQDPPSIGPNQYLNDPVLISILRRRLPSAVYDAIAPDLTAFGARVSSAEVAEWVRDAHANLPTLTQYDAWGKRVDLLHTTEGWRKMKMLSAQEGLVAIGYERKTGEHARMHQFAKIYLYSPSSALYTCPLAMTDGAARVMELHGEGFERRRVAYDRLTTRDPSKFWTSGQWMTERPGGSDVGRTESDAFLASNGTHSIKGFKWFSSATDSDMTLLLAREMDGQGVGKPGSRGLSLFFAETRKPDGTLNGIKIVRLKNKYGTKPLPTAELDLDNLIATRVGAPHRGVATIATILNITRLHAAVNCVGALRRAMVLVNSFARQREAFGQPLTSHPLHARTIADIESAHRAMTHAIFYVVALLGRTECSASASEDDAMLLRLLTPVIKSWTAKVSVAALSECMEGLGGQGYIEEVGIGYLLRDSQVNTIWEGTTNVLSLDILRVLKETKGKAYAVLEKHLHSLLQPFLSSAPASLRPAIDNLNKTLATLVASTSTGRIDEASARLLLFTTGRVLAGYLLVEHALATKDTIDVLVAKRWCGAPGGVVGAADLAFGIGSTASIEEDRAVAGFPAAAKL